MRPNLFHCLLAAIATLCVSCDSLEQEELITPERDTYYSIDLRLNASSLLNLGTLVYTDISVSEYNENNERIDIKNAYNLVLGDHKFFVADKRATKLTIYMKFHTTYQGQKYEFGYWVAKVYYLEKEENIDITIDGYTNIQSTNPIR